MTTTSTEPGTAPAWRRAADRLFPPAPAPGNPLRSLVTGAVLVAAGALVSLLRHPGTVAVDTVYAEDGTVFLAEAVADGPGAFASSYAGYYHLVPRLLAALAAAFPAGGAAAVLAISAALVTAGLAVLVFLASAGHLVSPLGRVLVSAPVVVAPLAQAEVPNAVANLHWPALYAMFWLLLWSPAGRTGRWVAPVVVALTACSDILVMVFLPLAALRLLARRDRYSAVLAGVLTVGVAVQVSGLLAGSSSRETALDPLQPVTGYVLRAVPAALVGERWLPDAGTDPRRLALAALAWLLLALVVVLAARRISAPRWTLAAAAAAHSVALYLLPVVLTGVAPPRYALAPALLLLVVLVALLHPATGPGAQRSAVPLLALAIASVAVWAMNFQVATPREHGPEWGPELRQARQECAAGQAPDGATVGVPVTPSDPDWVAELPCDYVTLR